MYARIYVGDSAKYMKDVIRSHHSWNNYSLRTQPAPGFTETSRWDHFQAMHYTLLDETEQIIGERVLLASDDKHDLQVLHRLFKKDISKKETREVQVDLLEELLNLNI